MATTNRERITRSKVDKFAERRTELATAALRTLAEQGYARTSLRDIAQNSAFSHGVLHYYFADKIELITYCVRQYKAQCDKRYDGATATAASAGELRGAFGAAMALTLVEDAKMHRLWYDLRNQSLYDETFRADVADIDDSLERMIWRVATKYAELSAAPLTVTSPVAYALMDGLFQHALLRHLAGGDSAPADLETRAGALLASLTARPG
jgi:AcrR family transcriptional regulator